MVLVNKKVAMDYLMGNELIFQRVKDSFLNSYQQFLSDYESLNATKDKNAAFNYIHSLKAISLNLGAETLYQAASVAVDSLKKELWIQEHIDSFFKTLEMTYNELKTL